MTTIAAVGAFLVMAGAVNLYLASPNQRLTRTPVRRRSAGWAGAAAMIAGVTLLLKWAGPATAIFIALTVAMLIWSFVPVAAAWARRPGERA